MPPKPAETGHHGSMAGRLLRRSLAILGGTSCGLGLGGLLAMYAIRLLFDTGRDSWGAWPIFMLMIAVSTIGGAILGFMASVSWTSRPDIEAYSVLDWLGLVLGVPIGIGCAYFVSRKYYMFYQALWLATLVPLLVVAGQVLVNRLLGRMVK